MSAPHRRRRFLALAAVATLLAVPTVAAPASAGAAVPYVAISGTGSSWAANAVSNWTANGTKFGWKVTYSGLGSSAGRTAFLNKTVDFAVSDIPFQAAPKDGSAVESPAVGSYAYMPIVAGGTAFMYHLTIGGKRVTNLRLSGTNVAKIFTGGITKWNDPAIAADNPGLALPATTVVPVVRSDGSGSSAQLSLWMISQNKAIWDAYYQRVGKGNVGIETSYWPTVPGMQALPGDPGVAGYVSNGTYGEGSIGYVQYSYAKSSGYPVVKMLNKAGYYVEPTASNVAVALTHAQIETQNTDPAVYLTQKLEGVYGDTDPRTYPLSAYSYMILPTYDPPLPSFSAGKAATLGAFSKYLLCQGQAAMPDLGYSPLPINLVQAGFDQLKKVPNVDAGSLSVTTCNNPTFSTDGTNTLAKTAPFPADCDKQGPTQCTTGTGGAQQSTQVKPAARGNGSGAAGGSTAAAGTGGAGTAASGSTQIDPDTGLPVGEGAAGGDQAAYASPVSLSNSNSGWGGAPLFALLAALLLVLVFVGPPLIIRRFGTRRDS